MCACDSKWVVVKTSNRPWATLPPPFTKCISIKFSWVSGIVFRLFLSSMRHPNIATVASTVSSHLAYTFISAISVVTQLPNFHPHTRVRECSSVCSGFVCFRNHLQFTHPQCRMFQSLIWSQIHYDQWITSEFTSNF